MKGTRARHWIRLQRALLCGIILLQAVSAVPAQRVTSRAPQAEPDAGEARYFSSNPLGMPLQEIASPYAGGEFVLIHRDQPGGQHYTLLQDGAEVWVRVHTPVPAGLRVEEYRDSVLVRTELRDASGRLLEERFLENGELREALRYTWSGERVQTVEQQLGETSTTLAYGYSRRGFGPVSVVDLAALLDSASGQGYRFALSSDGLYRLALIGGSEGYVSGLEGSSRPRWRLSLDADGAQTEWDYGPDGELRETRTTLPDGRVTVDTYRQGLVAESRTLVDGRTSVREEISRDADGNVTARRVFTGLLREEWIWDPAEGQDGTERYYRNGVLLRQTLREGDREVETRYRDGAPVLRITRIDGRRVREESIRDGEVVEEREFS